MPAFEIIDVGERQRHVSRIVVGLLSLKDSMKLSCEVFRLESASISSDPSFHAKESCVSPDLLIKQVLITSPFILKLLEFA